MDVANGILMTAYALYHEGRTPLGTVAFIAPDRAGNAPGNEFRKMVQRDVAGAFLRFERKEMQRGGRDRDALILSMRKLAKDCDRMDNPET
jgi:hypothetical protein